MKYIAGLMLLLFASVSWGACTGCGEEGHQQCVEDPDHSHATDQDHKHIEGLWCVRLLMLKACISCAAVSRSGVVPIGYPVCHLAPVPGPR